MPHSIESSIVGRPIRSDLKPIALWETTGSVAPGTQGAGCAVECIYCNQIAMDSVDGERQAPYLSGMVDGGLSINTRMYVGKKLDKTISLDNLQTALKQWPLYTPNSPVILENFNDPGNDWRATADLARMLVKDFGHTSAISFITKMGIKQHEVAALQEAQAAGAKLISIVTYTNMPTAIESSSSAVRLKTISRLKEAGIPVIVSMRPMIRGINDSQENIDQVLTEVAPYADVVIVGGLFVFEQFTIDAFREAGYELDESYSEQIYSPAKVMKMQYKEIVRDRVSTLGLPLLVHNHTSCAIAHILTTQYDQPTPDRFTHWISPNGLEFDDDCAHCVPEQKQHCVHVSEQPVEQIIAKASQVLERLGYDSVSLIPSLDVSHTLLLVDAVLSFDEIASIKEGCGWYVDNLPNAAGMHVRITEAFEEDLNLDPRFIVIGMVLIGQEWHIFIDDKNNTDLDVELIEKWIRSRSRHRARVVSLSQIQNSSIEELLPQLIQKSHGLQSENYLKKELSRMLDY